MSKSQMRRLRAQVVYPYRVYNVCEIPSGRLRDLPVIEQTDFARVLDGQTRPLAENTPMVEQDYFYICDYLDWKCGIPVWD